MFAYLRRDDGAVALIAAVAMLVLIGGAALVVDVGLLYTTRIEV